MWNLVAFYMWFTLNFCHSSGKNKDLHTKRKIMFLIPFCPQKEIAFIQCHTAHIQTILTTWVILSLSFLFKKPLSAQRYAPLFQHCLNRFIHPHFLLLACHTYECIDSRKWCGIYVWVLEVKSRQSALIKMTAKKKDGSKWLLFDNGAL